MLIDLTLNLLYWLYLGMDGPSMSKLFGKKLADQLNNDGTSFLNTGSCCLHMVPNAFCASLRSQLGYDVNQFAVDIVISSCPVLEKKTIS